MFSVVYPEFWKFLGKSGTFWNFFLEILEIFGIFGHFGFFFFENYELIYPSQRQNLLPTLEIITHNFQNFQKNQNFGKKYQNLEFFSKISKTTKGPPPPY